MHEALVSQETLHSSVPAREVFASNDEMLALAREGIANGSITAEMARTPEERKVADMRPFVLLGSGDVDVTGLTDSEKVVKFGAYEDFIFPDPDSILDRTQAVTQEELADAAVRASEWHHGDPFIEKELETDGQISQMLEITSEGHDSIKLINFTDTELTPDQLQKALGVLKRVAALSGGSVFKAVNAILIQKQDRFKDSAIGTSIGLTGTLTLNEKLINGELTDEQSAFSDVKASLFEEVLAHELAHLIEFEDADRSAYAKSTGWTYVSRKVVDDYGNVVETGQPKLETPSTIKTIEDGESQEVPSGRVYDSETIARAKPPTKYGFTNEREDFAESFVPFVFNERDDTAALDQIRRDAMGGVLRRGAAEYGPFDLNIEALPLDTRFGDQIRQTHFIVNEPLYKYEGEKSHEPNGQPKDTSLEGAYTSDYLPLVDDYGNQKQAFTRMPKRR